MNAQKKTLEKFYNSGVEYWQQGDFLNALKNFQPAADDGHIDAQYIVGRMYYLGEGVTKDYNKAASWFDKAANQGDAIAQLDLATMYLKGLGVTKDISLAVEWLKRSVNQNNAQAQFSLGEMYADGIGVPQSDVEALQLYAKSASQGYVNAINELRLISKKLADDSDGQGLFRYERGVCISYINAEDANSNLSEICNMISKQRDSENYASEYGFDVVLTQLRSEGPIIIILSDLPMNANPLYRMLYSHNNPIMKGSVSHIDRLNARHHVSSDKVTILCHKRWDSKI